jgi:putative ABC transport system permease protein
MTNEGQPAIRPRECRSARMSTRFVVRTASGRIFRHKVLAFVLFMVLLVSTACATLGLELIVASDAPFNHAFAVQQGADLTLTVNADEATAAQLTASEHAAGVTAASGPFPDVTVPFDSGGQLEGVLSVAGRSTPAGSVDTVDLTAGHWPDGPGQLVYDTKAGLNDGPEGNPEIGSRFQATTLPGQPTFTNATSWLVQQSQNDSTSAIMGPLVIAYALIGLIMAALIVFNVVSGAVVAQYRRIGVLKSLGMTPGQVIAVYLDRIGWPALAACRTTRSPPRSRPRRAPPTRTSSTTARSPSRPSRSRLTPRSSRVPPPGRGGR